MAGGEQYVEMLSGASGTGTLRVDRWSRREATLTSVPSHSMCVCVGVGVGVCARTFVKVAKASAYYGWVQIIIH